MLVIHPKDQSTDFLKILYEGREDVRLIDGYTSSKEIRHLLNHVHPGETVLLLGHGCPDGLFALEENCYRLINMHGFSYYLRKHFVVGVFCFVNQFAEKECLFGLFTGMVISEKTEAETINVNMTQEELDRENVKFAARLRKLLDENCPANEIPKRIKAMGEAKTEHIRYNYDSVYTVGYNG